MTQITIAKYSFIAAVCGLIITGAGCTASTPTPLEKYATKITSEANVSTTPPTVHTPTVANSTTPTTKKVSKISEKNLIISAHFDKNDEFKHSIVLKNNQKIIHTLPMNIVHAIFNIGTEARGYLSQSMAFVDPTNSNLIYFTSYISSDETPNTPVYNTLYSYHLTTKKLTKVFEIELMNKELRIVGIEDRNIIIWPSVFDNTPGYCSSIWYSYRDGGLSSINLDKLSAGLQPYLPPAYKVQEGKNYITACEQEIQKSIAQ